MKGLPFVLLFTAMTFVAWGAYGPVLHHGADALDHDSMRAFVGVGLAYFLIAVIIPVLVLKRSGETGKWTVTGTIYSLIAGAVGAIGALGIILALGYGGRTVYVMPLVFGFAPVVNTLVTAWLSNSFRQISAVFIGGVIAAALGAGGVLFFKPPTPRATQPDLADGKAMTPADGGSQSEAPPEQANGDQEEADGDQTADSGEPAADNASPDADTNSADSADSGQAKSTGDEAAAEAPSESSNNVVGIILSIITAALCWGSYGPMLHVGQGKMAGSRLRPFACVGLAYFFIAVAAPMVLIYSRTEDPGVWTASGMTWSFLAGIAGAIGALGVILAFNSGGKPYYVMPLIFGFAPVINTFISLSEAGTWGLVKPMFWISLAVVIGGAITVLTNAPKPRPKPSPEPS